MLPWLVDRLAWSWPAVLAPLSLPAARGLLLLGLLWLLAIWRGDRLVGWLKARFQEPTKTDSATLARLHAGKRGTPTMGGLFVLLGLVAGLLLLADLSNRYVQAALWLAGAMTCLGAIDDLSKLRGGAGLSPRKKLAGQVVAAFPAAIWLCLRDGIGAEGEAIGISANQVGYWFIPWAILVLVSTCNAVNLTDGLDGLAGGCLILATMALSAVAILGGAGDGARELLVLSGGMLGGLLGFLRFNRHPARVFMGDTGSLPLGALLGLLALAVHGEWLLLLAGGVFVVEAVSVIAQVSWFRWSRRRLLLCAPLHHHFEFLGWSETRVVHSFWLASGICAGASVCVAWFVAR